MHELLRDESIELLNTVRVLCWDNFVFRSLRFGIKDTKNAEKKAGPFLGSFSLLGVQ